MRFHIIGLSHAPTHRRYSADAFAQKVRLLCKMLHMNNHIVYHYGIEGSEVLCTEHVDVVDHETFAKDHLTYDWKKDGFRIDPSLNCNQVFIQNSIEEINKRIQQNDFILCPFGIMHKPIADPFASKAIIVEPGIGYDLTFAPFRVFETYEWRAFIYGRENRSTNPLPNLYDAVIPNYYDLQDYIYEPNKEDYFFFIARPTILKGLEVAIKTVEAIGAKLVVAGQGSPPFTSPNMEFIGVVSIEERAKIMSKAKALFAPTLYFEPFGGVAIEAGLCGTPVITTDIGAFSSTVLHGVTGYRCNTLDDFVWAASNICSINPRDCRVYTEKNYSLERVYKMYARYFDTLYRLYTTPTGWYEITNNADYDYRMALKKFV